MGHIVSKHGINTDPQKVQAVSDLLTPSIPKQLCSFLGLASYYRRFIQSFAKVAAQLYNLIRKFPNAFKKLFCEKWNSECEKSFVLLKELLTNLHHFQDTPITQNILCLKSMQVSMVLERHCNNTKMVNYVSQRTPADHFVPTKGMGRITVRDVCILYLPSSKLSAYEQRCVTVGSFNFEIKYRSGKPLVNQK